MGQFQKCYGENQWPWFSEAAGRLRQRRPVSRQPLRGTAGDEVLLVRLDLGIAPVPALIGQLGPARKLAGLTPPLDRARMDTVTRGDCALRKPTADFRLRLHCDTSCVEV